MRPQLTSPTHRHRPSFSRHNWAVFGVVGFYALSTALIAVGGLYAAPAFLNAHSPTHLGTGASPVFTPADNGTDNNSSGDDNSSGDEGGDGGGCANNSTNDSQDDQGDNSTGEGDFPVFGTFWSDNETGDNDTNDSGDNETGDGDSDGNDTGNETGDGDSEGNETGNAEGGDGCGSLSDPPVTFKALGLPSGSTWSVAAGTPPVTQSNTTVGHMGKIVFGVSNGTLNYTITAPAGFGVAKIVGKGNPSQTSDFINGTTTLTVKFAPIVTLTFNETGLPAGTLWGVAIHTALPHGGPGPQSKNTTTSSISFTVVKGTWKFVITPKPGDFRAMPSHGAVGAGHKAPKVIKFRMIAAGVFFEEHGLAKHTLWQVNITGPETLSINSMTHVIKFFLENGTYTFTVWNFSGLHPHPASGTFVVTAPGPTLIELINYTATPSPVVSGLATAAPVASAGGLAVAAAPIES